MPLLTAATIADLIRENLHETWGLGVDLYAHLGESVALPAAGVSMTVVHREPGRPAQRFTITVTAEP